MLSVFRAKLNVSPQITHRISEIAHQISGVSHVCVLTSAMWQSIFEITRGVNQGVACYLSSQRLFLVRSAFVAGEV